MEFRPLLGDRRFRLGEGPHFDTSTQTLYWVDIYAGEAWSLNTVTGKTKSWQVGQLVSVVVPRVGGGLIAALKNQLAFLDPDSGDLKDFAQPEAQMLGNRSNESRVDPSGRFWLGTMQLDIGPNQENIPVTQNTGSLYRVETDGRWSKVETGIGISNTLVWDEERKRLYYGDSIAETIWAYDWDKDTGEIGNRRVFAKTEGRGVPDGSALDVEGFLWNARWGASCILRYSPDGRIERVIDLPVKQPTSCVFGGKNMTTLYVTSAAGGARTGRNIEGALLATQAPVPGQPCTRFAG